MIGAVRHAARCAIERRGVFCIDHVREHRAEGVDLFS
jgi:hypothetical protein